MGRSAVRRWGLIVLVGIFASLAVSCGGGPDAGRDRNVQSLAGQPCTKMGQTKVVGKVVHVCGREQNARLWYAAKNKSPKGATCTRVGSVKKQATGLVLCGSYKGKKMWIAVAALPAVVVEAAEAAASTTSTSMSTSPVAGGPGSESASATTAPVDSSSGGGSQPAFTPSTIVVPDKEVRKFAEELARPTKASLVVSIGDVVNGVAVTPPPVVQLVDDAGKPKSEAGVRVEVSAGRDDVVVKGGSVVTDAEGRATFKGLVLTGPPGEVALIFVPDGMVGDAVETELIIGETQRLSIVGLSGSVVAGEPIGVAPTVALVDVAGNVIDTPDANIQIEVVDLAEGTESVVARTFYSPVFKDFTVTKVGSYAVRFSATSDGKQFKEERTLEVLPASANSLVFALAPDFIVSSGAPFVTQPVLQIVDKFGNPVRRAGVEVTATLDPSPFGLWTTVPTVRYEGRTVATDASGKATFTELAVATMAGQYVQTFAAQSIESVRGAVTVVPGAQADIDFLTEPKSVRSGEPVGLQPVVRLVDSAGNTISSEGQTVTALPLGGSRSTNSTATFDREGVATFKNLTITGPAGSLELVFFVDGLQRTVVVDLIAGKVSELRALRHATSTLAGTKLAFDSEIQMFDSEGNPIIEEGVYIWANWTGASWFGVKTNEDGIAVFKDQVSYKAGKQEFLYQTAFYQGVKKIVEVTVQPLEANRPILVTQPSTSVKSGTRLATQPVVQMVDKFGNPVAIQGVTIRATLGGNPQQNALVSADREVTDKDGRAVFYGMEASGIAGTYRFYFFAYDYSGVWADEATELLPGEVSKIGLKAQLEGVASGAKPASVPVVVPLDKWGNVVPRSGMTARIILTPKINVDEAEKVLKVVGATATSDENGRASFGSLVVSGIAQAGYEVTYTATVDDKSFGPIEGWTVTLLPGAFARVRVELGTSVASGSSVGTVELLDLAGNRVSSTHNVSTTLRNDARTTWVTSGATREVRSGAGDFGSARVYGPKGASATLVVIVDGTSYARPDAVTFTSDPSEGVQGPSGGTVIYVSTTPVAAVEGHSAGGRIMEMSPPGWQYGNVPMELQQFAVSFSGLRPTSGVVGQGVRNLFSIQSRLLNSIASTADLATFAGFDDWFLPSSGEVSKLGSNTVRQSPGFSERESNLAGRCIWTSTVAATGGPISVYEYSSDKIVPRFAADLCLFRAVRIFG